VKSELNFHCSFNNSLIANLPVILFCLINHKHLFDPVHFDIGTGFVQHGLLAARVSSFSAC